MIRIVIIKCIGLFYLMKMRFFSRLIKGILGLLIIPTIVLGGLIITGTYSHLQLVEAVSDIPHTVVKALNKVSGDFSQTTVAESPSFELGYDKVLPLETSPQPLQVEVPTIIFEEPQIIEVSSSYDLITEEGVLEVEQVDVAPTEEVQQENHIEDVAIETVTEVVTASTEAAQVHVQVDSQPAQAVTVSTGVAVDDATAKEWIAQKESGGSYTVTNGIYIGRYQLSNAYLNGDHSPENQERVADEYVLQRYGSWSAAYQFWLANGWY